MPVKVRYAKFRLSGLVGRKSEVRNLERPEVEGFTIPKYGLWPKLSFIAVRRFNLGGGMGKRTVVKAVNTAAGSSDASTSTKRTLPPGASIAAVSISAVMLHLRHRRRRRA